MAAPKFNNPPHESTDPRTDHVPYPITPSHEIKALPRHDSPLYIMPVAGDRGARHPDLGRIMADGVLEALLGKDVTTN
jgi:hypothetical protein